VSPARPAWQHADLLGPTERLSKSSSSKPKRGGTLVAGLSGGGSSDTLDAQNPILDIDFARVRQLDNSLVEFDANVVPQLSLAESITPNSDATQWTIRLKPSVTFHDGKAVTADDVIFSLHRTLNPKSPLPGAQAPLPVDLTGLKKLATRTVRAHGASSADTRITFRTGSTASRSDTSTSWS